MKKFYLNKIVYYTAALAGMIFLVSFFIPVIFRLGGLVLILLVTAIIIDSIILFTKNKGIVARRILSDRFSIGDYNKVKILLQNNYGFSLKANHFEDVQLQE